jgi:hypothetical protein
MSKRLNSIYYCTVNSFASYGFADRMHAIKFFPVASGIKFVQIMGPVINFLANRANITTGIDIQ